MSAVVFVSGDFDDLRSRRVRFLQEAARLGEVTVFLWPDALVQKQRGTVPKFPLAERWYMLQAVRFVARVECLSDSTDPNVLPLTAEAGPGTWVDEEAHANESRRRFCQAHSFRYQVLPASQMAGFPEPPVGAATPGRKKVVVTGCYDWLHSGHVRFFEEVSNYGDLYVIVGHDANLRSLKGEGHPLLSQEERRYMVGSIKSVYGALISSGSGWLDADPEIRRLRPDIYAVNEDGDRGGKREYCQQRGIQYLVLKRVPAPGLQRRSSTDLRGF